MIELLTATNFRIVTPGAVLLLPVIYASFAGGLIAGTASAGIVVCYSLFLLDNPSQPLHYSLSSAQAIITLALTAFTVVFLVGLLKQRIAKGESQFRLLFAHHPLPMWVYDLKTLAFLEVNEAAVESYGFSRDEFLRMTIADIRPPEELPRMRAAVARRRYAPPDTGTWKHRLRNGRLIDVRTMAHKLAFADREAVLVMAENITERLRVEAQNAELKAELEQRVADRTAQLESTNQELEAFSYSVSHDLRAPLRSINGFSQALSEDYATALDGAGLAMVQRVQNAGRRMEQLIDDLLSLAQVSRAAIQRVPVDLSLLAEQIGAELQQANPKRSVELMIQPGMIVSGDPQLLRIALENLIGNAWKFTATRDLARIGFASRLEGGAQILELRDNGAGFDMAYADRLFGAFQRLHPASDYPGSGIGLATVQRIIHRHGGRIWAQSFAGQGATFSFTLGSSTEAPEGS